ncbi:MAG TPA: efflux RND transporter periplasmic adaptor subunit [Spirochaetota bacterium]|nr:efflux RND transporter periplasmic adaptor subunit [Spirochaetota bacterium]
MKSTAPRIKIAIVAVLLLAATGAAVYLLGDNAYFNRNNRVKPRVGPIVEAIYALGTVKSENVYNLKMGVSTTVTKLHVREGQDVRKNAPLASVDTGMLVRAPFAGTVTRIYSEEGEVVMPGVLLLTLMDLSKKYVQLSLDQNSALRVKKGLKAELSFETLRGKLLHGMVESVYPSGGQFLARIDVQGMPPEILPEMTADVAIEVSRRESALLVPLSSVNNGSITVDREGKLRQIRVSIGAIDGAWGEVIEGDIQATDVLVLGR